MLPLYQVIKLLGRGGMGAVYQGVQMSLERVVAIKILPPGLDGEDLDFSRRFKQEAKAMARLSHPGLVAVYDAGETADGLLYFVMEFVDGTDVQQMLLSQGRLPQEHALAITAHVCDALGYAHEHGIVHRDIKPSNIMVSSTGQVKVADFGLAKVAADTVDATRSNVAVGTPDFVAPESLTVGMTVDGRADVYAVGVMLYQMLTGNIPRGMFVLPSRMIQEIDPRFDEIITKAMQADRDLRFESAASLRGELDRILTTPLAAPEDTVAPATATSEAAPKPKSIWPVMAVVIAAACAAGAWMAFRPKTEPPSVVTPNTPTKVVPPASVDVTPPAPPSPPAESPTPVATAAPAAAVKVDAAEPKVEVITPAQPVTFTGGPWKKAPADVKSLAGQNKASLHLDAGWFSAGGSPFGLYPPGVPGVNQGIRARFKYAGAGTADVSVRRTTDANGKIHSYSLRLDESAALRLVEFTNAADLVKPQRKNLLNADKKLVIQNGDEVLLELLVIGGRLVGKVNGRVIATVDGVAIMPGRMSAYTERMQISGLEVIDLDGLSEADAKAAIDSSTAEDRAEAAQPANVAATEPPAPAATPAAAATPSPVPGGETDVQQRLAEIEGKFQALFGKLAGESFKTGAAQLTQQYVGALKREEGKAQQKGHLDEVLALQEEAKRMADAAPSAADDEAVPDLIKPLRETYRKTMTKLETDRNKAAVPAYQAYAQALDLYVTELTKAGRIEPAKRVHGLREGMNASLAATSSSPAKPEATPALQFRADEAARALAQWTLDAGGTVTIKEGAKQKDVHPNGQLPRGRFEVIEADPGDGLNGTVKPFPWTALPALKGISNLKIVQQTEVDADQVALFKGLPLDSLALVKCRMSDEIVESMAFPSSLKSLRFQGCGLTFKILSGLAQRLPNLEKLFIFEDSTDGAEALTELGKLKKLRHLGLGGKLTADMLQPVGSLSSLTELTLQSRACLDAATFGKLINLQSVLIGYRDHAHADDTRLMLPMLKSLPRLQQLFFHAAGLNDADLETLSQLPGITSLSLTANPEITDAGLGKLASMKRLEHLFLEDTAVTDAGLKPLEKMRSLKELNLRGTAVTDTGAKQLQIRLPGCSVSR